MDPMAEKYKSSSPYNFVDGNPVIRVDPDGADWYKEQNGTVKFDPKVQDKKDLKEGQSYLGNQYSENLKSGGTAKYRTDGSIKYSKEKDAYQRLASSISDNKNKPKEIFAINTLVPYILTCLIPKIDLPQFLGCICMEVQSLKTSRRVSID